MWNKQNLLPETVLLDMGRYGNGLALHKTTFACWTVFMYHIAQSFFRVMRQHYSCKTLYGPIRLKTGFLAVVNIRVCLLEICFISSFQMALVWPSLEVCVWTFLHRDAVALWPWTNWTHSQETHGVTEIIPSMTRCTALFSLWQLGICYHLRNAIVSFFMPL